MTKNVTIFKEMRPSTCAPRYNKKKKKESTAIIKLKRTRKQRDVWEKQIEEQRENKKQRIEP